MASSSSSSTSWACSRCTFLNPASHTSACQVCLSPPSPSPPPTTAAAAATSASSSSPLRWSCKACTFLNPVGNVSCEMCGTRFALASSAFLDEDDDPVEDPSSDPVGSVFWPLRLCGDKRGRRAESAESGECHRPEKLGRKEAGPSSGGDVDSGSNVNFYKVLSYNIWFREDVELNRRMKALGDLIQQHSPDIICFQEVTPNIYRIFQGSSWWKSYQCSVPQEMSAERSYFCMQMSKLPVREFVRKPFSNSVMGRELCIVDTDVGRGKTLVVATSHLESPCPAPPKYDQMYSKERVAQAKESVQLLNKLRNAILCGDMNWDDKLDGAFPLPAGWVDAWTELRPGESGWTYDTKSNPMLTGNWPLQKRLDRFICNLEDLRIISIDMVGLEPIPGLSYTKEKRVKNHVKTLVLPVLPSDHYGLLLTMQGL